MYIVCCYLQVKEKSSLPQRKYIFPNKQHRSRKHGASIHSLTVFTWQDVNTQQAEIKLKFFIQINFILTTISYYKYPNLKNILIKITEKK